MNHEKFDVPLAIVITLILCISSFGIAADYVKTLAVNQYLRGELKCEPKPFTENELVCITVGKD
jgi:hypothetical protein